LLHRTTPRPARARWTRLAAAVVAVGLVAAACGGDDDDADTDTGVTTEAGSDDDVTSTTPTDGSAPAGTTEGTAGTTEGTTDAGDDADAPSAGGTLRYAYPIGPSRFDPHKSTVGQDIRIFTLVYDRLVHYDETGTLSPGLATSWEFSDDGLQLTLELQEGVTFHDGETFDAEAVKANIERAKTVEGSAVVSDLASISEVQVVDPATAVLVLSKPDSALPGILSSRAGAMVSPAAFENPDLDLNPVGAGPYRVTQYTPDDLIVFEKFEEYWDTSYGGPDRVEWDIIADETTRLNALRGGQQDAALITGSQQQDAELAGYTVDPRPTLSYQTIYLNRSHPELNKLEVRQALSHAIDREVFVETVLFGAGAATVQDFPEGYYAHNPDYPADFYAYDPERAKELLAEAGVPDGFELEMLVPNLSTYQLGSQVVQQMWDEIGVTISLRQIDAASAGDIMFAQDASDTMIAQFGGRSDPQITMDLQYTAEGFLNAGDHTTDRYVELSAAAKETRDPDERAAALQAMEGEVVEQAFTIPLAHDFNINAYSEEVQGFNLLAGGEMDFRNMSVGQG
jgi:peptide/nickel transport system substrate-binding protein